MAGRALAGPILRHRLLISKASHINPSAPGGKHRKLQELQVLSYLTHGLVGLAGMSSHCSPHPTHTKGTPTSGLELASLVWVGVSACPTPPHSRLRTWRSHLPPFTHRPPEHEGSVPTVLQNPQPPSLLKDDIPHSMRESQLLSEHQLLSAGIKLEDEDHRNAFQERETGHHCNPRPTVAFHTTQPSTRPASTTL